MSARRTPRAMHFRAVVDQFGVTPVLDPLSTTLFVAAFALAALLTARRTGYGLCALWLAAPVDFAHAFAGTTVTLEKVALLGVLLGLTAHRGALRRLREPEIVSILIALAAYAGAIALSVLAAAFPHETLRETLKAAEYLAVCAAAFLCWRLDGGTAPLAATVAATTALVCLSALAQEVLGAPSGLCVGGLVIPRIAGLLEGPNQLAAYLESAVAFLAAWSAARPSRWTPAALALAAATGVLTYSRAGVAGIAVAVAVALFAYRRAALRAVGWAAGGALAGLAVAAGWAVTLHEAGLLRLTLLESDCTGGVGNRPELYAAAVRLWLQHPLLGVGAGNFELEIAQAGVPGVRTHANSWYLQSLVEGGLPLLAATLAAVATPLVVLGRRMRESPLPVAAVAATLALALHQIVDYVAFYPKVAEPWLLLLGAGAAALAPRNEDA